MLTCWEKDSTAIDFLALLLQPFHNIGYGGPYLRP